MSGPTPSRQLATHLTVFCLSNEGQSPLRGFVVGVGVCNAQGVYCTCNH